MTSRNSYIVNDINKIENNDFVNPGFLEDSTDQNIEDNTKKGQTTSSRNTEAVNEVVAERGHWGGSAEFILSCLGFAVGLGNVWRFPYMVYQNGGGAFLIPYFFMLLLIGLPCFFMEMIVGQYSARGPIHLWSLSPIFRGIGFGMVIVTFLGSISYNVIMGWSFYYLFASWQNTIPWSECTHDYNTPNCYTVKESEICEKNYNTSNTYMANTTFLITNNSTGMINQTFTNLTSSIEGFWWYNQTCYNSTYCMANDNLLACNRTYVDSSRVSSAQEYFKKRVLKISPSLDESGNLQWELILVLLLAWILCWMCVVKGIKSTGKVVYFTAIFPYVVLFILLVRGALLEGSLNGVIYYVKPRWNRLRNARVWVDAAGQVFFSLGVGMGSLMTFASYNKFHNNIYRDTLIVVGADAITSILAGFPIFSIIGHLALKLGKDVDNVVESGPGLAFIVYPEVVSILPVSQLWATLFFLMLLTLGVDSQMASIETIMTALSDSFPSIRKWKALVAAIICFVLFLLGFTMCLQSGEYWLSIMTTYPNGWSLILIAAFELIVFSWVYGARRLMSNLEEMTGVKLWYHWFILFKFIGPVLVLAILIFSFVDYRPLKYSNKEDFPVWSQVLGMLMALLSIVLIPILAVYVVYKSYSDTEYEGLSFGKRILALTRPSSKWMTGPEKARLEAHQAVDNDNQF